MAASQPTRVRGQNVKYVKEATVSIAHAARTKKISRSKCRDLFSPVLSSSLMWLLDISAANAPGKPRQASADVSPLRARRLPPASAGCYPAHSSLGFMSKARSDPRDEATRSQKRCRNVEHHYEHRGYAQTPTCSLSPGRQAECETKCG